MKKINLLFLGIVSVLNSHGQQKEGWLTWTSADNTISISYPKEWSEIKLNSGEIAGFAAPKDGEQDHYSDMLVLRAFPDSGIKSIDKLRNYAATTLSPEWHFRIMSSQKIVTKAGQYIKSIAEDKGKKVILVMYTLLKEDKIFFLTLNIEKRNYERYKAAGDTAFESLAVKREWVPR